MGSTLPGGVHGAQNLPELSHHSGKPFRGRTPYSLPGSFRLCNECHPGKRTGQGAVTSLLMQPSSEGSRGEVPEDGKSDPAIDNHNQKTPTLLPSSYRRSLM